MNCDLVREQEIAERYLLNQLDEEQRQNFELHYFSCVRCFERTEALRTMRDVLAQDRQQILAETVPAPRRLFRQWSILAPAGALAFAILAFVLLRAPQPAPQATVQNSTAAKTQTTSPLLALAKIEPPAYAPVVLRGTHSEALRTFQEAMQAYVRGDFHAAIPGLEAAARQDPRDPGIAYYLGACYLLTDRAADAADTLRHSISVGDSPYLEAMHYHLAKAYLRQGDANAARKELASTIELRGDWAGKASDLLRRLELLSR